MKTLADFKRALTIGSQWKFENWLYGTYGIRTITKVLSKGFWCLREDGIEVYIDFPRACNCCIVNSKVRIYTEHEEESKVMFVFERV
jgi:hypothetical protein